MRACPVVLGLVALPLLASCSGTEPGRVAVTAQVTLNVYSGRPDPSWNLDQTRTDELMQKTSALPASVAPPGFPPSKLGYRGFRVQALDASSQTVAVFTVYGGTVRRDQMSVTSYSADVERAVERWLLSTGLPTLSPETYSEVAASIS